MAKITGKSSKNNYGFYALVTETKGSNYLATNVTTLNYEVYIVNANARTNSSNWTFNAKVDGSNVYNKTSQTLVTNDTDYNAAKKLFSGTKDITHNSDGKKTITFSASLTKTSAYSTYDPGECTLSGSFKLTDIPRASAVTCPSGNIGEVVNIVVSKNVETYTSTLTWECDSLVGTIAEKTAEKTVPFTIPTSLYDLIPNETSKTVTIKCTTYNGNTKIGDTQSTTMVARVAADTNKPSLSFTIQETNQKVIDVLGSATTNIGILNASIFKVKATASAKNKATIDRYVVTNGATTITSTNPEISMRKLEDAIITVTVYDSRGISNSVSLDLSEQLINYYAPNISKINVRRENQTSSNIYLNIVGSLYWGALTSSINNSLSITYKYKKVKDPDTAWSALKEISDIMLSVDSLGYADINLVDELVADDCEYTSAYEFQFFINDKLTTIEKTGLIVPQGIMTLGIGKENVYINGGLKVANVDGSNRRDLVNLVNTNTSNIAKLPQEIIDKIYPIGSIFVMPTNTSPASLLGGTWTLIDKEFTPASGNAGFTRTNANSATLAYARHGHNIYCRLTFTNSKTLNDTSVEIGKADLASLGVADLTYSKYPIGQSDGGAALLMMGVNSSTGAVAVNDVIDKGGAHQISTTGTTCYVEWSNTINSGNMLDSACNKFYFKRTA